ncbi:MAG: hypothetical protein EB032_02475 [Betaproteobacteria bacterium]|nr:hypothetical protein [Betaproteobacteria bacterium]
MSAQTVPQVDVAIVGCGPAGVVLATLLGQAGVQVHICDRLPGIYEIPRAIALDHEILRVFQQMGVIDQILPFTEPFTNSEFFGVDVQYCEPDRPCTLVIGPQNHRRWEISLKADEDPVEAATPEATWNFLKRWLTPEDGTLWRQSSYRFHALVAERWREGRVFLAGDAAHMQPPFLGQGMCQGIRDVANLAWKLTAVLQGEVKGQAAQRLLDSYGQERKAHVHELTSRIKSVGALICERDVEKARARDRKLLDDCGGLVKDTPRQDILPSLTTGLLFPSPGAGTLFPQPRLQNGVLMDHVHGCHWRWVTDGTVQAAVPPGLSVIDLSINAEAEGVVALWMQRHGVHAALVRPDHYVFASAANASEAQQLFETWLSQLN